MSQALKYIMPLQLSRARLLVQCHVQCHDIVHSYVQRHYVHDVVHIDSTYHNVHVFFYQ